MRPSIVTNQNKYMKKQLKHLFEDFCETCLSLSVFAALLEFLDPPLFVESTSCMSFEKLHCLSASCSAFVLRDSPPPRVSWQRSLI